MKLNTQVEKPARDVGLPYAQTRVGYVYRMVTNGDLKDGLTYVRVEGGMMLLGDKRSSHNWRYSDNEGNLKNQRWIPATEVNVVYPE